MKEETYTRYACENCGYTTRHKNEADAHKCMPVEVGMTYVNLDCGVIHIISVNEHKLAKCVVIDNDGCVDETFSISIANIHFYGWFPITESESNDFRELLEFKIEQLKNGLKEFEKYEIRK